LQYLWSQEEPRNFSQLLTHFNEVAGKNWKKQTLNTFLLRLRKKGFVEAKPVGTKICYIPTISSEEYYHRYARQIVDNSFDSSLKSFVCAFSGNQKISPQEKDELMEFLKGL
jgi:predicted transcriptional regulator